MNELKSQVFEKWFNQSNHSHIKSLDSYEVLVLRLDFILELFWLKIIEFIGNKWSNFFLIFNIQNYLFGRRLEYQLLSLLVPTIKLTVVFHRLTIFIKNVHLFIQPQRLNLLLQILLKLIPLLNPLGIHKYHKNPPFFKAPLLKRLVSIIQLNQTCQQNYHLNKHHYNLS